MTKWERSQEKFEYPEDVQGEGLDGDMRRPFARHVNSLFKKLGKVGDNTVIDLKDSLGEVPVSHIRFRDAIEEGKLKVYIKQEARDPKVITTSVVAIGIVAAGIYRLRYKNSKK